MARVRRLLRTRVHPLLRTGAWTACITLAFGAVATAPLSAETEAGAECNELTSRIDELEREIAHLRAQSAGPLFGSKTAWKDPRSWVRLRRGMSRYEVMGTLGQPGRIVRYDAFERWEYPDFLGGRVTIGESGRLGGWRPPPGRRAGR